MGYVATLTSQGRTLMAEAVTGKAKIIFTRVTIGSGQLLDKDPTKLEDLVHYEIDSKIATNERDGYYAVLNTAFDNVGVSAGFSVSEIGIYADGQGLSEKDILYAYISVTDGDGGKVPAEDAASIRRKMLINAYIGTAKNVSAKLDSRLVYATMEDLEEHKNDKEAHKEIVKGLQTRTDLLELNESFEDLDVTVPACKASGVPDEPDKHSRFNLKNLINAIEKKLFPFTKGMVVKREGQVFGCDKAEPGRDYQDATNNMNTCQRIPGEDAQLWFPAWNQEPASYESDHCRVSLDYFVEHIRQCFFIGVTGMTKIDKEKKVQAANAGTDYQDATQNLESTDKVQDSDVVPFYSPSDGKHHNMTVALFNRNIKDNALGTKPGILRMTESGGVSRAVADTDYMEPVSKLSESGDTQDGDYFGFYDASAASSRKISWASIKKSIKSYCDTLYTKVTVDQRLNSGSGNAISNAAVTNAINGKISQVFHAGASAPSDKKLLWIDTTSKTGGLKYWNGSKWARVPLTYSDVV